MSILRSLVPVALLLALAASGRAQAADVPPRSDPYAVAPSFDGATPRWQGFYAGAHAGGGFGKAGPANTSGMVGGVQAGYNWQADKVVVGVEADVSASGIRNNSYADKTRQKWLGTIRARAGYSFGNVLAYGTAGLAGSTTEIKNGLGKSSTGQTGFAVGGGAEMMMGANVTVRGEYLRYQMGDANYPALPGPIKVDTNANVFRGGINYKF